MGPLDVSLSRTFVAGTQKQDDGCPVPGVIDAVTGTRIDPQLTDPAANTLPVAKVSVA
jgi:hypothetical protein